MNEAWLKSKEWWATLSLREKQAITVGAGLLALFIVYQWIWTPYLETLGTMRKRILAEQKTLVWMQAADKQLQQLDHKPKNTHRITSPVRLLSAVQKRLQQSGLAQYLTQLKQTGNDSVEIHFQKVEFDKLMGVLIQFAKEQPIAILQMSVTAENTPGMVNADIVIRLV